MVFSRILPLVILVLWCAVLAQAYSTPIPPRKKASSAPKAAPKPKQEGNDYSNDLFVEGHVYCSKKCGPNKRTAVDTPVKGAIVSVTCINLYGLKTDFMSGKTDAKGYFLIDLPDYSYKTFGVSQCKAKLVAARGPDCHFVTDENKGHSGAPLLKKQTVVGGGKKLVYTVGPFYTVPNKCAKWV